MSIGLAGIKVVDLTQGVSGPFATRLLSQMGARIIKVERPGVGDLIRGWDTIVNGMCSGHAWVNPGKESLALDLKSETGRAILLELVKDADVLIENFVPGTMEDWGFTYDKFKALNPRLVYCRISGFGQEEGSYRNRSALDLIIQGEAGLILTNGSPQEPAKISLSLCDISGSMYATIGILEALFHRTTSNEGQEIQVALLDSIMTWTGYFPYMFWHGGKLPERVGLHHHTMAPYGPYPTKGGKMVIVAGGAGQKAHWLRFCEAIHRPKLAEDPKFETNALRLENREEMDQQICAAMTEYDRDYWLARFHEFGFPSGAMNDLGEALDHPRIKARGLIKEVDSAVGKVKVFDFPPQFSKLESVNKLGPPALGEHTQSILAELGLSVEKIAALQQAKVVQIGAGAGAGK